MAWSRILGHEEQAKRFRDALKRGRLPHAYLFVGSEGIGKELVARELAKALECAEGKDEACDACPACAKVEHGNHPDVTFVRRTERNEKGEGRSRIVIDQVREQIQQPIGFKPFEGRWKVFVVAEAERLTEEAQNCLLKTLEEPPPHSMLILVASRTEGLVETVLSRCQIVRFRPLPTDTVEGILVAKHEVEPVRARVLARLSGGSPGRALRYQENGAYETTLWLLRELAKVQAGAEFAIAAELMDKAKEAGGPLEDVRERMRPVIDLLTLAWRDLFLSASGYPDVLLTWGAGCEALAGVGAGLPAASARRLVRASLEAREQMDMNANIKLLVEKMLLDFAGLLRAIPPEGHSQKPSGGYPNRSRAQEAST